MKRMLFNATQAEELRVAIVDGQKLSTLTSSPPARNNARATSTRPSSPASSPAWKPASSITAAERHGFLPFKEISRAFPAAQRRPHPGKPERRLELLVQVEKDERGNKGAALTNQVSWPAATWC
jgi:ribonuclease E